MIVSLAGFLAKTFAAGRLLFLDSVSTPPPQQNHSGLNKSRLETWAKSLALSSLVMLSVGLVGCANFNTDRSTEIPAKSKDGTDGGSGKLVHLDAQQRVVITNGLGSICAEPSPDALAAYASAVGLGGSVPGKGAASIAQALQSTAGSIGLRTQSITLMRDALYRLCEAYSNKVVSPIMMPTLLARSLDLTAVIVAIEQLTGAVAASQVVWAVALMPERQRVW